MINRNTPRNSGALPSALSIKVYSDNKELNMQDLFLLDYASNVLRVKVKFIGYYKKNYIYKDQKIAIKIE